jgi:hypothetical protein
MKNLTTKRLAVSLLQSALLSPALAFGQAAGGVFHFSVPGAGAGGATVAIGFRGEALGYETRVPQGQILEVQYAILHALAGWDGDYASVRTHDTALLTQAGIQVAPLDPTARRILDSQLGEIRKERNFGVPSHENAHRPISLQQMAEKHRELIAQYQQSGQVKYVAPGAATYGAAGPTAAQRQAALQDLTIGIAKLAAVAPTDDAGWRAAVAAVNATLARFGRGDLVDASKPRADAMSGLLAVYDRELTTAKVAAGGRPLPLPETAALRNQYGALFDGSAGPKPVIPSGDQLTAGLRRDAALNATYAPMPMVVPAPHSASGDGDQDHQSGLLGMLGGLLMGLFRTVSRVVSAAIGGAIGVVKALFS